MYGAILYKYCVLILLKSHYIVDMGICLLLVFVAQITLHTQVWAVLCGATPSLAAAAGLNCICSRLLKQPAAVVVGPRVWSLSREHRCAKPLEYPCAGEPRTDHRGGLSLSSRQTGKSQGESMAVEEEGLRVFQSVKIKIGKKKSLPPVCAPQWMAPY